MANLINLFKISYSDWSILNAWSKEFFITIICEYSSVKTLGPV